MTPQPSEQPRLDDCKHDQIVRMVLADESHDWQCVGCGSFFVPYQRREPERGVETLLYDVTEAAATMLEADEFASVDERRLIRAVSAARGYFMHADAPDPVASPRWEEWARRLAPLVHDGLIDAPNERQIIDKAFALARLLDEHLPDPVASPAEAVRLLAAVLDQFDYWTGEPRPAIDGGTVRLHNFREVQPPMEKVLAEARRFLEGPVASPAPLDGALLFHVMAERWPYHDEGEGGTGDPPPGGWRSWRVRDPMLLSKEWLDGRHRGLPGCVGSARSRGAGTR